MKALRKTQAAAGLELVDVPLPEVDSPDDVLVRVQRHRHLRQRPARRRLDAELRVHHAEPAGDARPRVRRRRARPAPLRGQRVVVRPSVTCGVCAACIAGRHDACERRTGIGMTRDGAFAPWVRVPLRNCVPVPDGLSDELAALAEPLSISMQALRVAGDVARPARAGDGAGHDRPGHRGAGAPRRRGAGGGQRPRRRGAARRAAPHGLRRAGRRRRAVAGRGDARRTRRAQSFDVVFEATGVPETITEALAAAAPQRHRRRHRHPCAAACRST